MMGRPTAGISFKGFAGAATPRCGPCVIIPDYHIVRTRWPLLIRWKDHICTLPEGAVPVEVHQLSRGDASGIREAVSEPVRTPRILCWNCRKLTPFHEDRCEFCGARFAGSTGGVYAGRRLEVRSLPLVPADDQELTEARRSLLQLFEDLQRVHDVSSAHRYDPVRQEETITLFQCPSCGRFVAQDAPECICGVRFVEERSARVCPDCGTPLGADGEGCAMCARAARDDPSAYLYSCPLCGAEVAEDAVRCSCGARFED